MLKIIKVKLFNNYYNNFLARFFKIKKTLKIIIKKYYWVTLYYYIKIYIKRYNICLLSKIVRYQFNSKFVSSLYLFISNKIY